MAYGIEHLQVKTHAVTSEVPILISATPSGGFPGGSKVKNLPTMQEMPIWSLGWEDPLEKDMTTLQDSCLGNPMDGGAWWATVHGVAKELDMT